MLLNVPTLFVAHSFHIYTSRVPLDAELNKLSYPKVPMGQLCFATESIAYRFPAVTQLIPFNCCRGRKEMLKEFVHEEL